MQPLQAFRLNSYVLFEVAGTNYNRNQDPFFLSPDNISLSQHGVLSSFCSSPRAHTFMQNSSHVVETVVADLNQQWPGNILTA